MNFVLIPFFLAVNVTVDHPETWIHGPEYTLAGTFDYLVTADATEEPFDSSTIRSALKCRPKAGESLLCRIENTTTTFHPDFEPYATDTLHLNDTFEIKFNKRGVESLLFQEPLGITKLNVIRGFAALLSVGADLSANALSSFVANEHFILGECSTHFSITNAENPRDDPSDEPTENAWNYQLNLLTSSERSLGPDIVIEKRTEYKRCVDEDLSRLVGPDFKIGKSFTRMHISDTFWAENEVHAKMSKSNGPRNSILRTMVKLELKGIEPAKEELPSITFHETASLHYAESMQRNFIL